MPTTPVNETKRRLLDLLKRSDECKVADLAPQLGISDNAVRQHLEDLEATGLVGRHNAANSGRRGRPSSVWRLTDLASDLFPDRHSDLTIELIEAIRTAVGNDGLDAVIRARSQRQLEAYRLIVPSPDSGVRLIDRVRALADQRTAEGYLAEVTPLDASDETAGVVLTEHHCPICDAAATCQGLCREELAIFQAALGDDVAIERTTHALAGDQRCTYEIRRAK